MIGSKLQNTHIFTTAVINILEHRRYTQRTYQTTRRITYIDYAVSASTTDAKFYTSKNN